MSDNLSRCEDPYNYNTEERQLWIFIVENCWNFHCNVDANRCPFYFSVYFIQQVITLLVCEITDVNIKVLTIGFIRTAIPITITHYNMNLIIVCIQSSNLNFAKKFFKGNNSSLI